MFIIECRIKTTIVNGPWFKIWESEDGHDCADYLQTLVQSENIAGRSEYKMTYQDSNVK